MGGHDEPGPQYFPMEDILHWDDVLAELHAEDVKRLEKRLADEAAMDDVSE